MLTLNKPFWSKDQIFFETNLDEIWTWSRSSFNVCHIATSYLDKVLSAASSLTSETSKAAWNYIAIIHVSKSSGKINRQ